MDEVKNLNNYSILLLSAGMGRRLGDTGKKHPKCLLKINNKSSVRLFDINKIGINPKKINKELKWKSKTNINQITPFSHPQGPPSMITLFN